MNAPHLHYHRRSDDEAPDQPPPGGMTQEQLDFFTEQTLRAVKKATRRDRRTAIVGFLVLLVGLALALSTSARQADRTREAVVTSGRAVAVEGCNRDFVDRQDFRSLLERLKTASESNKTTTPEQKQQAVVFYDAQLKRFVLPDCRKSAALLTDDPNAQIPIIAPYFPGAPYIPSDSS